MNKLCLLGAAALIAVGCTRSDAGTHKAAAARMAAAQQQTPVNDRWVLANCPQRTLEYFEANADRYDRILYHFGNSAYHAHMFDLLYGGLEITTGGQRLHRRDALERALLARGLAPASFESHLKMFELGMPPHGGLAIGLERLTALILGLQNVRDATLYPRDRYRLTP